MPQEVIRQHARHHGLADRHRADARGRGGLYDVGGVAAAAPKGLNFLIIDI
jgi:hypothetical protein